MPLHHPADGSPPPQGEDLGASAALFSRERQTTFLAALAATGNVRSASARAGVSHQTAYRARLASPGFRRAWDAALLAARAQAEEVLASRALDGWEEDVLYHGEVVATRRRYSDRLLLAHLARLDKLCGDAEVAHFADAFDDHLARYAAGEDRPAQPPVAEAEEGDEDLSSGQWSGRSTPHGPARHERDACAGDDDPVDIPPPLAETVDDMGFPATEAQLLNVGFYRLAHDEARDRTLTNWPAPPQFAAEWFRLAVDGGFDPIAPDPADPELADDGEPWPDVEAAFRTLSPEEAAFVERRAAEWGAARAARLALYYRAAFGLATSAERASLCAANDGVWPLEAWR